MSGIFNAAIFNNAAFNTGASQVVVEEAVKTGTGGIDRRRIIKPTGLLHLPKKKADRIEQRVDESRAIQAEIAARLAKEFSEETPEFRPIVEMTMTEVEAEIGMLLRKKLRTDEDEVILLLLMAASA